MRRLLYSGAAEPEEPDSLRDSEWAAVSSASDSQGCRTQDEHAARVFQEIEDGNFGAMNDIAEEVAAVNAVAAAKAGEKRAAAQSAAAKAANMAVAAARRSEKATKAAAKRFEKDAKKQCRSATLTPVEEEGGGGSSAPRRPSLAWRTHRRVGPCWRGTRRNGGSRLSMGSDFVSST